MNDNVGYQKKSAGTYSRESQLDFSFFQPIWWNMKLWQDVVGKLKESREQKKEKNSLKRTDEKEKIVHEYCRRKHNKIANEKTIKQNMIRGWWPTSLANMLQFLFLTN